ncbi:hypothetical protein BC938DRAFT_472598 [Jimgerdemannia flammicorona]|uniref:DUF6787 domain-containing protein n=1 Tax=Jimgerdemannia flammicorona TaxID=994334 RepID=A0A433Q5R5_9FUNG|nr:hypothetical protein BC938DRAFT_472598 [Jimgerdemannia flammicorona]
MSYEIHGRFRRPWATSPWIPYRLTLIFLTLPVYTVLIFVIGTIAGQHQYFANIVWKMWGWAVPKWCRSHGAVGEERKHVGHSSEVPVANIV